MTHDVFISHSSKDKPIADAICTNLEIAGVRCWIAPRDIAPGDDWPRAISNAISQCRIMVLIFSANANSSEQISRELSVAADNNLVIIPFKIENVKPEPGKQFFLSRTHWLDAMNPPTQKQIDLLVERVKSILPKAGTSSLAKEQEDHYQDRGEMVKAFENLQSDGSSQPVPKTISTERKRNRNILMILLGPAALVLLAVFGLPSLIGKPEPTPQASMTPKDTAISMDTTTPTVSVTMPILTIQSFRSIINTPLPLEQGSILDECRSGGGLCLTRNGKTTHLTFVNASELRSWSWAPDGKQFVVSYCLPENLGKTPCEQLYIVNIETKTVTQLFDGPDDFYFAPAWSPDGKTIIYNYHSGLEVMRFDGATWQHGVRIQFPNTCLFQPITWAPDSRQVAWVAGPDCQGPDGGKVNQVLITDLNTQTTQTIFETADANEFLFDGFSSGQRFNLAWSPDGKFVAVKLRNGTVYQVDVSCVERPAGCDVSSRTKIDSIPANWLNNFYPQWGGVLSPPSTDSIEAGGPTEAPTPTSSITSPQAERARAFAEPILTIIAQRKPDFEDDFSKASPAWRFCGTSGTFAIEDGVARSQEGDGCMYHETALTGKDFILQFDARLVSGDTTSQIILRFHAVSNTHDFNLFLHPAIQAWDIGSKWGNNEFPTLTSGEDAVSPIGKSTQIMIVTRGSRFALYLNQTPVGFFDNSNLDNAGKTFFNCMSDSPAVCEFDNIKFWDLANIRGLP